ncbi:MULTISPECIES: patatin-like phospholipase family protein [Streptosporangium]|uniref:NTE family protein n=1 Tax=Streptosporangium brasiliense TaxID=47480 RepID=A0ABT9RMJ4_9ACTN|nr:patatin-like phospholipase family protein [Streptosporangium brasiliense]MDP9869540.1 NTE family protein [Streptosporangium brasiliense]
MKRALVLGPGGVVGTAWLAGLAVGLRRTGVDLADADLIVGTSAGAIVGAMLAVGEDLDRLASLPGPRDGDTTTDPARLAEVFATLGDPALDREEKLRRIGRVALTADVAPERAHLDRTAALINARDWPGRPLLITAVDTETGESVVWDQDGDAPLLSAVASSYAVPGLYPPVTINGHRYMDGAFRAGASADLAAGADVVIVIEPLAHVFPSGSPLSIAPDQEALDAFGSDLHDRSAWEASYQAGVRQAAPAAERVGGLWNGTAG